MRHVLGLLDLSLKFIDMKIPFGWRYPETYLHPGTVVELSDIMIIWINENAESK